MKKVLSIVWKGFKVYMISNALAWSFVGIGKYFKDCDDNEEVKPRKIRNSLTDEAFEGWKGFLDLTVEVVKDCLGIS